MALHLPSWSKWDYGRLQQLHSDCIVTLHVASKDNLADFYTKILPADDFERLRDLQMSTLVVPNLSRL